MEKNSLIFLSPEVWSFRDVRLHILFVLKDTILFLELSTYGWINVESFCKAFMYKNIWLTSILHENNRWKLCPPMYQQNWTDFPGNFTYALKFRKKSRMKTGTLQIQVPQENAANPENAAACYFLCSNT